jgi:ATP-dependent Clp protease ATP-binding subunit ClpC
MQNELNQLRTKNKQSRKATVDVDDIRSVIAKWSGVPINSLKTDDLKKIENIDKALKEKIIGQEDAIKRISAVLKRARLDLSNELKPLASFLFLGPTGVGKTHTAKEIAKNLFGSEDALIQVDMSEYMEQHSVSKLIGSPPGYVGFQEGGQLTEKIRRHPYSVVLFDEIEKAHPDLLNILLQILEEGSLVDAKGRKINFKNCIIIMTSNIGAWESFEEKSLGFDLVSSDKKKLEKEYDKMKETILEILKDNLSPEFLNRIDEILIFKKLEPEDAEKIIALQLNELNQRIYKKNLVLQFGNDLVKYLAKIGYSSEYGARNLKRTIVEKVENSLAEFLLGSKMVGKQPQMIKINIKVKNEQIKFTI